MHMWIKYNNKANSFCYWLQVKKCPDHPREPQGVGDHCKAIPSQCHYPTPEAGILAHKL